MKVTQKTQKYRDMIDDQLSRIERTLQLNPDFVNNYSSLKGDINNIAPGKSPICIDLWDIRHRVSTIICVKEYFVTEFTS